MKLLITGMLTVTFLFLSSDFAEAKKAKKKKEEKQKVYFINRKALPVLTLDQVSKLQHHQRVRYVMQMRRAYDLGEVIDSKLKYKRRKKSAQNQGYDNELWSLILGSQAAYAANYDSTKFCIHHGNLIERVNGECNIKKTKYYNKENNTVQCGSGTGLRGSYAIVPYYDSSPQKNSLSPYGTSGTCGGTAKALAEALTSGKIEGPLKSRRKEVIRDREIYQDAIKKYQDYLKEQANKPITKESLEERRKLMAPMINFTVVPKVEAHQIRLAADYKDLTGDYPIELNYITSKINARNFDKLALQQEAIERLGRGKPVSPEQLVKIGFTKSLAEEIADLIHKTPDNHKATVGKELLYKYYGLKPEDGIYSNYDKNGSNTDSHYGEIIDYCTGPADKNKTEKAHLPHHTNIKCDKDSPTNVKDCIQYLECTFYIEESGGELIDGRFKDVVDAYMNLRDNMYNVCGSLPTDDRNAQPICRLKNEAEAPRILASKNIEVVPPPPPPKPQVLERQESFGCSKIDYSRSSDLVSLSPAGCTLCALEADAKAVESLEYTDTDYIKNGVSQKWMTLLGTMARVCKKNQDPPTLIDVLALAEKFGHCSNSKYNWDNGLSENESNFVRFIQTGPFLKIIGSNKKSLQNMGWNEKKESYFDFINRKFKEIFGLHLLSSEGVNQHAQGDDSKLENFQNEGLSNYFCNNNSKVPDLAATNIDTDLKSCMNDGLQFAKKNYKRGQCYSRTNNMPSEIDTFVPIINSQKQWQCDVSSEVEHKANSPALVKFYQVINNESYSNVSARNIYSGFKYASSNDSSKNCGGKGCKDALDSTYLVYNKCLSEKLKTVPSRSQQGGKAEPSREAK